MDYLGDFAEDTTVNIFFTTHDSSGAAVAPSTAFEAADVIIYKDNSATQKTTQNGMTMTSPFDSITGVHLISIDTSNDTGDAGFWVTGSDYTAVLSPDETVDGQTVARVLAQWSIENRNPSADIASVLVDTEAIILDTESINTDTETTLLADTEAILGDTNELQTDWVNGGRLDLIVDAILADTESINTDTETTLLADTEAILADSEAISLDTESINTDTETTLLADTEAILTDSEAILVDTEALDTATILTDTEAILADTEARGLTPLATGTAQASAAGTLVLAASSAFADNELRGNVAKLTGGTGVGQARVITSNTLADDTCQVSPNWTTTPDTSTTYEIVEGAVELTTVGYTAQTAGDIIADTEAILVDTEALDTATVLTDTEAILADTEAAVPVLTDTEAILLDSEAILVDTGTTLLADTEAILTDTENMVTDTEAAILDTEAILTDSEAIVADTENIVDTTRAEPGQGAPGATLTAMNKIDYLYKAWRNRSNQTATTWQLFADDATTVDQKVTVSDDGTTFEKGEVATGP